MEGRLGRARARRHGSPRSGASRRPPLRVRDVAFFTLLETYDCSEKAPAGVRVCSSDEATATLTFRDESRQKTVFHDHGDGVAPPLLDALEKGVDEIIDTARWIH